MMHPLVSTARICRSCLCQQFHIMLKLVPSEIPTWRSESMNLLWCEISKPTVMTMVGFWSSNISKRNFEDFVVSFPRAKTNNPALSVS